MCIGPRFRPATALMVALVVAVTASACGGTDNLTAVPLSSGGVPATEAP